jgi:hypothetical protein
MRGRKAAEQPLVNDQRQPLLVTLTTLFQVSSVQTSCLRFRFRKRARLQGLRYSKFKSVFHRLNLSLGLAPESGVLAVRDGLFFVRNTPAIRFERRWNLCLRRISWC